MKTQRQNWLDTGLALLREGRFDALTIDELCKRLDRTKGAFYHHFAGIDPFKEAVLANWERTHTLEPIDKANRHSGRMRKTTLYSALDELDPKLERTIRAWSTIDTIAAAACARVDAQRMAYLVGLLGDNPSAKENERAERAYAALIGRLFIQPLRAGLRSKRRSNDET